MRKSRAVVVLRVVAENPRMRKEIYAKVEIDNKEKAEMLLC